MSKKTFTLALLMGLAAPATLATAQDILVNKPVYPLGGAKTWVSSNDVEYTTNVEDLAKLTQEPTNTSNIYLFPEAGGGWATDANKAIGIQGFYIDMEKSQAVGTVSTTWEGAAANAYDIYLTDAQPTLDILSTTPTYSASGLGQYQANTAVLPDGSNGRYLVFQPTDATNWGWGVKIRSIQATAPQASVLTTVNVTPSIVLAGETTDLTFSAVDQLGLSIDASAYTVTVSDNATLVDGKLTVNTGTYADLTFKMGDVEIVKTVYVATVPPVPSTSDIKYALFSNGYTENNADVKWMAGYNGGATTLGLFTFPNGEVAQGYANTRCVFIGNTDGGDLRSYAPLANGWRTLCIDIFATQNVEGFVEFEGVTGPEDVLKTNNFTLTAGEWNHIEVNVKGAEKLNNLSVRFNEQNASTILLANIYFTPAYVEGDETAPVINSVVATPGMNSVTFELSATDDLNSEVSYVISDGEKTYATAGKSGETLTYTVTGLASSTDYTFTVVANDGLNESEPYTVAVRTTGMPDAPTPAQTSEWVTAIFSPYFGADAVPAFANWGSAGKMGTDVTDSGAKVLSFTDYQGQWGGLDNLNVSAAGKKSLHLDIYGDATEGRLTVAPVWKDATVDTPNKTLTVLPAQWNSYDIELSDFGFANYGVDVIQLALTNSTMSSFLMTNIYFWGDDTSTSVNLEASSLNIVEVYTLQGVCVARNIAADELSNLPAGLYIVRDEKTVRKVIVK